MSLEPVEGWPDDRRAPEVVRVAAGVIRNPEGRILLSRRPPGKHLAGTWEFPGGKCEPGENAADALARELAEELHVRVRRCAPLLGLTHAYPEATVRLLLREVLAHDGEVRAGEGQQLGWFSCSEMTRLDMPAADRPIVKALTVDPRYAITPPPRTVGGLGGMVEWAERVLASGVGLLQLRAPGWDRDRMIELADAVRPLARRHGARWLINGPAELAELTGADGVHLPARELARLNKRPLPEDRLVVASCHDAGELKRAGAVGADFVTLSPVRATASHPQAAPLGWAGLEELCEHSPLPVFTLGGVGPDDLDRAREHGAFGVAGISAFLV